MDFDKVNIDAVAYNVKDSLARQQLSALEERVPAEKYYIFQGDSYADENGEWPYLLAQLMGLSPEKYTIIADGGDGFSTMGIAGNLFWTTLQAQANKVADKNAVTDIVVCGGRNDCYNNSYDSIIAGIATYNAVAKELFPNAKLHIGFIGWDLNTTEVDINKELWLANACYSYIEGCGKNGNHYLTGVEYAMHNSALYQSDGKHPNSLGSAVIAGAIFNALVYGAADVQYPWLGVGCTASGVCTDLGGLSMSEKLDNGGVTYWPVQHHANLTITPTTMTLDGSTFYEIANCPVKYFNGTSYDLHSFPVTSVIHTSNDQYYLAPASLSVTARKLRYRGLYIQNNNYLTVDNVVNIQLYPAGPFSFDTMS